MPIAVNEVHPEMTTVSMFVSEENRSAPLKAQENKNNKKHYVCMTKCGQVVLCPFSSSVHSQPQKGSNFTRVLERLIMLVQLHLNALHLLT